MNEKVKEFGIIQLLVKNPFLDFFWQNIVKKPKTCWLKWSGLFFPQQSSLFFPSKNSIKILPEMFLDINAVQGRGSNCLFFKKIHFWAENDIFWKFILFKTHQWPKIYHSHISKKILKLWFSNFHRIQPTQVFRKKEKLWTPNI